MSSNLSPGNPIQPLSIGNVVSAGVRLYNSNLKSYLRLAVIANLWALIPIYGWAKYAAISGVISRLAFSELISQPETVTTASNRVNSRMWSFLRISIQIGLSLVLVYLAVAIAGFAVGMIFLLIFGAILGTAGVAAASVLSIIIITGVILVGLTWFYSRWSLAEVVLAVEDNVNGAESIDRSWDLTKAAVLRVQGVVLVAFIVTLPILIVTSYVPQIFLLRVEQGSFVYWTLYIISLLTSLVSGVFVLPFWQAIKAVVYYDLRSRREGLGLQLRRNF